MNCHCFRAELYKLPHQSRNMGPPPPAINQRYGAPQKCLCIFYFSWAEEFIRLTTVSLFHLKGRKIKSNWEMFLPSRDDWINEHQHSPVAQILRFICTTGETLTVLYQVTGRSLEQKVKWSVSCWIRLYFGGVESGGQVSAVWLIAITTRQQDSSEKRQDVFEMNLTTARAGRPAQTRETWGTRQTRNCDEAVLRELRSQD